MITNCSMCGNLYEAGSEEQANEPARMCRACVNEQLRIVGLPPIGGHKLAQAQAAAAYAGGSDATGTNLDTTV